MFTFLKYLTWCLSPLAIALLALLLAAVFAFRRRTFFAGAGFLFAFLFLLLTSLPTTMLWTGYPLESRFPPQPIADFQKADAIVVLGGGIGAYQAPLLYPELYTSADRAHQAARLYKAKLAPIVIPSGTGTKFSDAVVLEELGVPKKDILIENASRNTAENASETIRILQERNVKRILLVTSSWHMPRAMMLFSGGGFEVIPAAADHEVTLFKAKLPQIPCWQLLPSGEALQRNSTFLKEYLGMAFYTLRKPETAKKK